MDEDVEESGLNNEEVGCLESVKIVAFPPSSRPRTRIDFLVPLI